MIAKVLDFFRRVREGLHYVELLGDPGGNRPKTYQYFGPSGDDSPPLPEDDFAVVPGAGRGTEHAVGVSDPRNAGTALPGEIHRQARDANGVPIGHFWIRRDGTSELITPGGTLSLSPTGVGRMYAAVEVHLDSPLVKLTDSAGREVARRGDPVAVRIPPLANSGGPVLPVTGSATPSGGIAASGQIIAGDPKTLVSG